MPKLSKIQESKNVAELLDEDALSRIGHRVCEDFRVDQTSREGWLEKMKKANELALQVTKDKNYPWDGASNVKFPLITIASLQFASRAYPNLVKAPNLVKMRVQGHDPEGKKAARAARVSQHMSWQLLEQDDRWEEDQDKAFLALPILGCVFKKTYFDATKGHNCSKVVLPKNLAVHYYARSIEEAERKTEIFELYAREIKERQLRKVYRELDLYAPQQGEERDEDKRQGTTPPPMDSSAPRTLLEQHCYLDLDEDGYPEPYVVTVDKTTEKVFRIFPRFKEVVSEQSLRIEQLRGTMMELAEQMPQSIEQLPPEQQMQAVNLAKQVEERMRAIEAEMRALSGQEPKVLRIVPIEYYTKYTFIPSPDGGFYDLGFGMLLGPLNASVNTLINQLIDAGTMSIGSSGFIGKGARIKGGKVRLRPNEWLRVDATGQQLKDSFFPLPVNPPSPVLFQLLGLLIEYTQRIASVTDTIQGENPGQNTPAYNMGQMLEQGLQVFNGIFKRVYRAFRKELHKLYHLNGIYLNTTEYFEYHDQEVSVLREDYSADPKDLIPAADPSAFSNMEKVQKAVMLKQNAAMSPGYDPIAIEKMWLEAMDIPNSDELYPLMQNPETGQLELVNKPGPSPEFQIEAMKEQRLTMDSQAKHQVDLMLAQSKLAVDEAQIVSLMARAEKDADSVNLERLKLLADDLKSQREAMTQIEVSKNAARASRGVGGKPSNS